MMGDETNRADPLQDAYAQAAEVRAVAAWWRGIAQMSREVRTANHFRSTWEKGRRRQAGETSA